jgi:hypothetical protein
VATTVASFWLLPAAVVAVGAALLALLAARLAARVEALRASLVEVPAVRDSLRAAQHELDRVRLTVDDLHRR